MNRSPASRLVLRMVADRLGSARELNTMQNTGLSAAMTLSRCSCDLSVTYAGR